MKKREKGFTLIELIIVVAIIGILASIAVPKYGDIQKDAKIAADIATAKNIASVANVKIAKNEYSNLYSYKIDGDNFSSFGLQSEPKSNLRLNHNYWIKVVDSNPIIYIASLEGDCTSGNQVYPEPKKATGNTETEWNEYYDKYVKK